MEDIGLFKQGWAWLHSKKICYSVAKTNLSCLRERVGRFMDRHWPMMCYGCARFGQGILFLLRVWKDCLVRGCRSLVGLDSAALLVILWSCFLSLTSLSCLVYFVLSMGAAGTAVHYLGLTPGLFIVGIFAILILWMYANFWIMGTLVIVGGYLFSLNHARIVVLMAIVYVLYYVKVQAGFLGVFITINLALLSNDLLNYLLQWCDNLNESTHFEEPKGTETFSEDFSTEFEYSVNTDEDEKSQSSNSKTSSIPVSPPTPATIPKICPTKAVVKVDIGSHAEMKRILSSSSHYEVLGVSRHKKIDTVSLKKEYRKKAMLVHPDKNMGSPLASESFKKVQCAFEILSDAVKKREYDVELRKEESKIIVHRSSSTSHKDRSDYCFEESRLIQCTKCGTSHIWVCTNRTKTKARWCQDCCQYHQAKNGDGWVEYKGSLVFDRPKKVSSPLKWHGSYIVATESIALPWAGALVEIPRAFVCAEDKIFDVSEWAICQGMSCRPNTHRPSFHVNLVGLDKSTQRSNPSRYQWHSDEETMDDEEEFDMWLQQALASGLFCETPKRRKIWSPFKLHLKKGKWKRSS